MYLSLVGTGIGFAVVGAIFGLLSIFKPDLRFLRKDSNPQLFYREQGIMAMFFVFGLLMIFAGAVLFPNAPEGENPAASMLGTGVGLAVIGTIFGLLSVYKPNIGMFRGYTEKKLWQTQGMLLMVAAFGVMFILMGVMAKPWAV